MLKISAIFQCFTMLKISEIPVLYSAKKFCIIRTHSIQNTWYPVKFNLLSTAISKDKENVCEGKEKHCRFNTSARDCMFTG
jgi:hypothetical protein